jgi:RNA polymerase sigma-70 factor, ECF subfamily
MDSEKIWLLYSKELKGFILSKVKDRTISDDLLQDVFLKLHLNINKLKDETKIRQWLFSITRNVINDHFRKEKFKMDPGELNANETSSNANEQLSKCMYPHINRLPLKYKEAITKVEFENYSQLRLAKELNISYSGAKSRVQRAKELLKTYFQQCCRVSADKYGNIISFSGKHQCKMC